MSKLETLRCDICGKTYLNDEAKDDIILATTGEKGMAYNDVCPRCRENIHRVIAAPNSIEDLESCAKTWEVKTNEVFEKIENVWRIVTGYGRYCSLDNRYTENFDVKLFTSKLEDIVRHHKGEINLRRQTEYLLEKTKASRNRWMSVAIGTTIGLVIGTILTLIFG